MLYRQRAGGRCCNWRTASARCCRAGPLLVVESALFMVALLMPIADVHAVNAVAPLLVVALSVPMLGEKVGPRRWAAVLVGFVGVLLIIRPGFEKIEPPVLIVLLGASMWSLYQILVRLCARVDRPATTTLYTALVGLGASTRRAGGMGLARRQRLAMLGAIAIMGSLSHVALIRALGMTQPALLQPTTTRCSSGGGGRLPDVRRHTRPVDAGGRGDHHRLRSLCLASGAGAGRADVAISSAAAAAASPGSPRSANSRWS
jgi:hypothetical protein